MVTQSHSALHSPPCLRKKGSHYICCLGTISRMRSIKNVFILNMLIIKKWKRALIQALPKIIFSFVSAIVLWKISKNHQYIFICWRCIPCKWIQRTASATYICNYVAPSQLTESTTKIERFKWLEDRHYGQIHYWCLIKICSYLVKMVSINWSSRGSSG